MGDIQEGIFQFTLHPQRPLARLPERMGKLERKEDIVDRKLRLGDQFVVDIHLRGELPPVRDQFLRNLDRDAELDFLAQCNRLG